MADDETYSVAETAKVLGISSRRVQQLVSSGDLAGYQQDNGYYRIYRYAVNERRSSETSKARKSRSAGTDQGRKVAELEREIRGLHERIGRSEAKLELTEQAESTLQAERDRLAADLDAERQRTHAVEAEARQLRDQLEQARKPWYRKLFGR